MFIIDSFYVIVSVKNLKTGQGGYFLGGIFLGGIFLGGIFPGGNFPGGIFRGGFFSRGYFLESLLPSNSLEISTPLRLI